MNICIVTGIFPPDIGGPATYVPEIAQGLIARGHTVTVITLADEPRCCAQQYPYPVVRLRRSLVRPLRFCLSVATVLRHGTGADVLFVNGLALEAVVANMLLRKPLVQKIVGDLAWERLRTQARVTDSLDTFQTRRYGVGIELLKKLRAFWVRRSSALITPSDYLARIVRGWGVPHSKIMVIRNAVHLAAAEPPAPTSADRPAKIVSIGRMVPWKGFPELIRAAGAISRQVELHIIGEGPERDRIERAARDCGPGVQVHLPGALPRENVRACLREARVFVLNSSYEGLPHIVLEAMAAGAAVIATDAGGTGEIVHHDVTGLLVPVGDEAALRQAIERLLTDESLRTRLVTCAQATLRGFSREQMLQETEALLVQFAGARDLRVLFLSTARITVPPDATTLKKWQGLAPCFCSTVLSFSARFSLNANMLPGAATVLLPDGMPRLLRYVLYGACAFSMTFCGALFRRWHVVVAQSPYEAAPAALALLPWRVLRTRRRPRLIVEIHSDWRDGVMLYHRWRLAWLEKRLRRLVGGFCLRCADAYRPISDYCAGLLPRAKKPVFVFPTFTDLSQFQRPRAETLAAVRAKHGSGFFLFAGMLIYLKGTHHLIAAFCRVAADHPEARLIIAGTGTERPALERQAARCGITDKVIFIGHVGQEELAAYMANALAFVLPSLTEGLGRVAIEAQLLERPVIASRVGGLPEIVDHGRSGLLCRPGSEQDLAAAMCSLLADPARADAMGKTGRRSAQTRFDYATYFQSYRDMVQAVCRG